MCSAAKSYIEGTGLQAIYTDDLLGHLGTLCANEMEMAVKSWMICTADLDLRAVQLVDCLLIRNVDSAPDRAANPVGAHAADARPLPHILHLIMLCLICPLLCPLVDACRTSANVSAGAPGEQLVWSSVSKHVRPSEIAGEVSTATAYEKSLRHHKSLKSICGW